MTGSRTLKSGARLAPAMLDEARRAVARRAADLAQRTPGRSGNLSVRADDRFAISPTGVPWSELESNDVPVMGLLGKQLYGELTPSSEEPLHAEIYRNRDAGAVVHAHSPWATTLAARREPVPTVHYALAKAGGRVPVADYATYGSDELATNAVSAMDSAGTTACLLANHGVVSTGRHLDEAFETLDAVEFTARIAVQAGADGAPVELPADELDRVSGKFDHYGQP